MKKIKVLCVFGTRPEAIKMIPVINELKDRNNIENLICVTAQHRELLDQVLEEFDIIPDFDLNIMKKNQSLEKITADMIVKISKIIKKVKPTIVLVHGDTTTALSASLAAFYNKVDIGHIEAGLRAYNKYSPYPEEQNRKLIDSLCDFHFAPTEVDKVNLIKENIEENKIYITGNTIVDFIYQNKEYLKPKKNQSNQTKKILLTTHRRENLGQQMVSIFNAIKKLSLDHQDLEVIFPIHKNPEIRKLANEYLSNINNIKIIEPLSVKNFYKELSTIDLIVSDSGGIQEEALTLKKPMLILRDTTERSYILKEDTLKLIGTKEEKIIEEVNIILKNLPTERKLEFNELLGNGKASITIVDIIEKNYIERNENNE